MTVTTVNGWDATSANLSKVPSVMGPYGGGYITGSDGVPWTMAQRDQYPQAVMYDQSSIVTSVDITADAFDLENGAVTVGEIAQCVKDGRSAFNVVARIGQRWPAVYMSESNVTTVVNALIAGGVTSCPLIVADYSYSYTEALADVANASGPFPIVGVQYSDAGGNGAYDLDVWSLEWLNNRSKMATESYAVSTLPPGEWRGPIVLTGEGIDGNIYTTTLKADGKTWETPVKAA